MLSFLYCDNPDIDKTLKVKSSRLPPFLPTSPVVSNLDLVIACHRDRCGVCCALERERARSRSESEDEWRCLQPWQLLGLNMGLNENF